MAATTDLDLGPLSWVKGEIDLALGRAHEALGKFAGNPADSAQLTLITCWPFDAVRPGTAQRYVVIADRA